MKANIFEKRLLQPLDHSIEQIAGHPLTNEQVRNLRFFWLDGLFAAASEAFFLSYTALYAVAYGASNGQVGVISSLGNLMGVAALFPGARFMERYRRRKPIVLWSGGGLGRLVLLLLALIPFFLTSPLWAMVAIVALNGVRIFMSNFGNPAWTAIVADIIPQAMRGRYISNRNFAMGAATLLITPLAGWLIKIGAGWSSSKVIGYQIAFFLAFIVGMISTWAFSRIQEPVVAKPSAEKQRRGGLFSQLRQNPAFAGFVISAFVWNLSLQIAGPFFNVYMKNNLGGSEFQVGLAASISSISSILGQLFWGRLLDRKGALWLQTLTGFSITILPTLWIFYTAPEQVFINNSLGGALWAGYNLANFNLLLSLTPDHDRPRAVALYQTAVFTSSVIGPLIGGYVADAIDFKLIFVMSGAGRFIAMVIFLLMSVLRRKSQLVIS